MNTSDYPKNHALFSMVNKNKIFENMKDECAGRPIAKYISLRLKMNSIFEICGKKYLRLVVKTPKRLRG